MTNNPPKITSLPAGTPSGEWANKTESMLQSNTVTTDPAMTATSKPEEHPVTTTTNLNTPGHEFPGSYPKELENSGQEQQEPQNNGSEGSPMASVVHAAKHYMPDNVERTVEYAGQTAAAYLPIPQGFKDTVNSYWSHDQCRQGCDSDQRLSTSLPSSETKGAQPFEHVGGVGSLPGTLSESSVALLPDERAMKTPVSKDEPEGDNQAKSAAFLAGGSGVGKTESFVPSQSPLSQVQSIQDGTQTDTPQAEMASTANTDKPHAMPEEQRSRVAEATGVGAVTAVGAESAAEQPGPTDRATTGHRVPTRESQTKDAEKLSTPEHAVTPQPSTVPEGHGSRVAETVTTDQHQEAQAQTRDQSRGETATGGAEVAGAGGTSGLSKNDYEHELTSQETQQKKQEETRSNIREVTGEGVKHTHQVGAGAGEYDTGYHPAKTHSPPTGETADQAQSGSPVSPTSTANVADNPKERRVSFFHKVRGEAKIIAGKVSGKENKVEEGKRIIHGEL